jgi:hypothetical protein
VRHVRDQAGLDLSTCSTWLHMLTLMYQRSKEVVAWPGITPPCAQSAEYEAVAVFCVPADGLVPSADAWPAVHASYEEWRKRKNSADELAKVGALVTTLWWHTSCVGASVWPVKKHDLVSRQHCTHVYACYCISMVTSCSAWVPSQGTGRQGTPPAAANGTAAGKEATPGGHFESNSRNVLGCTGHMPSHAGSGV